MSITFRNILNKGNKQKRIAIMLSVNKVYNTPLKLRVVAPCLFLGPIQVSD